jgi:PAS domain S-box-containing protein
MRLATKETETENLFETLANKSPVGLYIVQDGKFCYTNPTFQSTTGYTEDELLGRDSLELVVPEDRERVRENAIKMLKGKLTLPYQFRVTNKNDSARWIMESVVSIRYRGRQATLGSFVDITERKQAEEALQAEKNKLQALINAIEYNLSIQDTEFNIIYQNEPSKIATGGDHLGKKCYRAYGGREKVCDGCPVEEVFKDGKSHTTERRMVIPSGEVIFMESTATPIRDAGGRIVSCLEIVRNITERKRAEEARREAEEEKSALLEEAPVGIIHADLKGKITYVNKRFESESGYSREEIVGKSGFQLDWFPAGTMRHLTKRMAARLRGSPGKHWETPFKCKDGRWIWIELEGKILRRLGVPVGFQIIARNITERKRAEEALQAEKNKLQSLIDSMEDTITIQDTEFNIIYQNEPSMIASGGDHVGEKCYWAYEGQESICEECPVEKAFKDGKSHTTERRTAISGEVAFWENTANPIRDAAGRVVSCLELARNITERKKQEQALADEATRRRLLVDQSLDGIAVLDVDAKVVEANQRFAEMLGYTLEEVRELHTWDWDKKFPPEKILEMGRNVDEKGFHLETQHTRKDGSIIDVDISINAAMFGGQKLIFCVGRDVTERKRAEEALKDSEQSYRELADSITEVFFAMDEHLRYTYWNKASEILTGVRAEDALGKSLLEVFPDTPGTRRAEKVYRDVLRTQQSQTFVNEFNIDGRHYTFEISAYPSRDGISVFVRDITERKQTEEALQQSEEKYRALFDSTVIGTIVIDAETMKVVMANKAAAKIFGLSSVEEGMGANPLDFAPPEGKERVLELIVKELFEQDLQQTHEFRMITKDGREIWVSATAARIMHEGRLAGLVSLTDITVRKEMEEAIKQAAEEWRNTFDSISDAISIHDREFRILRANKAFADIFHMKPSQIIGKHCYELHKGEKPKSGCPQKQTLATEKPAVTEFYESHLGKFLLESTSPIFNEKGEIVGIVHVTRDITAQKQQNERLMMTDRLASIGELAAGTAHELNNPLTSVIGFSQLLMEKDISDDIREDLKLIYNEAQRAASVTKNLLTFARKHTPVKQLSQINNIIEDVLKLRAYEHKVNGIEVKRRLAPDLPEIMVDNFQMQQVFLNIIINAEYFMIEAHNRGTLTITTQKQNGSTVRISIADDGPGIPQENLRRIFDPFFTTKEAGKGTGLGLSICHGIVAEHGGQIYARSQSGKGATISVELPINGL